VRVTRLDTRFTGVRVSLAQVLGRSPEPVTAQAATATATVPLSGSAGLHISATGRDVQFAAGG
jgi:hypothetical protein